MCRACQWASLRCRAVGVAIGAASGHEGRSTVVDPANCAPLTAIASVRARQPRRAGRWDTMSYTFSRSPERRHGTAAKPRAPSAIPPASQLSAVMSGWDVADVSYSEQRLAEHVPEGHRARTRAQFFSFLHEYQEENANIYDERLRNNYQAGAWCHAARSLSLNFVPVSVPVISRMF